MPQRIEAFSDDPVAIPDDAILYRRVDWDRIGGRDKCPSGEKGTLNANCFRDYPDERSRVAGYPGPCMSVGISTVLDELGYSADKLLEGYEGYGLAEITAGDIRRLVCADGSPCPQGIMPDPTEAEPWHGIIFDAAKRPRKTAACKAIARRARWTVPLVNV